MRSAAELTERVTEGTVVRIAGTVQILDEVLTSPLSGRSCVLQRTRYQWSSTEAPSAARGPVRGRGESFDIVPFEIRRDETTVVVVVGDHALLDLPPVSPDEHEHARITQFILRHGYAHTRTRSLFEEVIVEPGSRIDVLGVATFEAISVFRGAEGGFRDGPVGQPAIVGTRKHPLAIRLAGPDSAEVMTGKAARKMQ